jgi:hypothetical protein
MDGGSCLVRRCRRSDGLAPRIAATIASGSRSRRSRSSTAARAASCSAATEAGPGNHGAVRVRRRSCGVARAAPSCLQMSRIAALRSTTRRHRLRLRSPRIRRRKPEDHGSGRRQDHRHRRGQSRPRKHPALRRARRRGSALIQGGSGRRVRVGPAAKIPRARSLVGAGISARGTSHTSHSSARFFSRGAQKMPASLVA